MKIFMDFGNGAAMVCFKTRTNGRIRYLFGNDVFDNLS